MRIAADAAVPATPRQIDYLLTIGKAGESESLRPMRESDGRRGFPLLRSGRGLPAAVRVCRSAVESIIGGLSTVVSLEHSEPGIAFDATAIRSNRRSPACREGTVALSLDNATLGQDGADALRPAKSWSFFCAATGAMGKWAVFGRFSPRRPERLAARGR